MEMRMDEYDVVIPAYNAAAYLEAAVDSVAKQTIPPKAIIIVDDGSADNTAEVMKNLAGKYPQVQCLFNPHLMVSAARNAGLRHSTAPYIAFLDSDDIWHPQKIEKQMEAFSRQHDRELGIIYCNYDLMDEAGLPIVCEQKVISPTLRGNIHANLIGGNFVSGSASAVLMKRAVLEKIGLLDETLTHGEDWDYWLRAAEFFNYDFVDECLVSLRVHKKSAQAANDREKVSRIFYQHARVLGKWYGKLPIPGHLTQEARESVCRMCARANFHPRKMADIYKSLKNSESPYARNLFRNWLDLGAMLFWRIIVFLYWRVKKILYLILKKPFVDLHAYLTNRGEAKEHHQK